jgi:hypothetical protein
MIGLDECPPEISSADGTEDAQQREDEIGVGVGRAARSGAEMTDCIDQDLAFAACRGNASMVQCHRELL